MSEPEWSREHNDFTFKWPNGLALRLERVREGTSGVEGELIAETNNAEAPHIVGPIRVNLTSDRDRQNVTKQLCARVSPKVNWQPHVETLFAVTVREFRRGSPTIDLATVNPPKGIDYFLSNFLPRGQTGIMFADGGSLKSTLAIATAVTAITGFAVVSRWRLSGPLTPVLYLDWETSEDTVARGAQGFARGIRQTLPQGWFHYLPMVRPLFDDIRRIREEIGRLGIGYVIVDSLGFAAGDEPESNRSATQVMNALRSLGPDVTKLCIGHVAKSSANTRGRARTFGGVYLENGARTVWEVRRQESSDGPDFQNGDDDDEELSTAETIQRGPVKIALYHRKVNQGPLRSPFGLEVHFDDEGSPFRIVGSEVKAGDDLAEGMTLGQRIMLTLRDSRKPLPIFKLASILEETPEKLRVTLHRLGDRVVRLDQDWDEDGKKAKTVWALRAFQEHS